MSHPAKADVVVDLSCIPIEKVVKKVKDKILRQGRSQLKRRNRQKQRILAERLFNQTTGVAGSVFDDGPVPVINIPEPCSSQIGDGENNTSNVQNQTVSRCGADCCYGDHSRFPDWQSEHRVSIWNKLQSNCLPSFTKAEEDEIDARADKYVSTVIPNTKYYILPQNIHQHDTENKMLSAVYRDLTKQKQTPRKRRKSPQSMECYLTHHSRSDFYDNTTLLPTGCRLIKPTHTLVQLVAKAILGSPDGLLQVQQIYAVLQNCYPYFRYIDKSAASSWRSSIRHALYQKCFLKTRFKTETINTRGCYWRIKNDCNHVGLEQVLSNMKCAKMNQQKICQRRTVECTATTTACTLQDVVDIAKECGINIPESDTNDGSTSIPSLIQDADPILLTSAADWGEQKPDSILEEESKTGIISPSSPVLYLHQLDSSLFFPSTDSESTQLWTETELTDLAPASLLSPIHQFPPLSPVTNNNQQYPLNDQQPFISNICI